MTKMSQEVKTEATKPSIFVTRAPSLVRRNSSLKRKEAARKTLFGSISTRHIADVRYSSPPRLKSEPCRHDIQFPRLHIRDKSVRECGQVYVKPDHLSTRSQSSPGTRSDSDEKQSRGANVKRSKSINHNAAGNKGANKNVSLPEIIMEFNIETSMVASGDRREYSYSRSTPEIPEDERVLGAPYEEYLRRPKRSFYNPCHAKHRPVTPGLLDSLNKLRVPSKVKTEQWIKSAQYIQKSNCGHIYKTDQLDHSNLAFPNWIYCYTDTT